MNFDGSTSTKALSLLNGQTLSTVTTVYSSAVQPNGFRYTLFLLNSYYASGTLATTGRLQDSDDGVNFTDIANTTVTPSQAATVVGATSFLVRHEAVRQYVRLAVSRSASPNVVVGVTAVQFGKINTGASELDLVAR